MSEQIARSEFKRLVGSNEWQTFSKYLFDDFLKAQEAIIGKFATQQDSYDYKEALKAKQSIEWFREWIELFRNGGGGIVQYDSAQETQDSFNDYYYGGEK